MTPDAVPSLSAAQLAALVTGGLRLNPAPGQDVMSAPACGVQGGPRAGVMMFAGLPVRAVPR